MGFMRKYQKKYGGLFGLAVFFLMVEALTDLLLPTLLAELIDRGVAGKDMETVWRLGGLMLLITAVGAGAACMRNILASRVSQAFGTELRSDLFRKIQSLEFGVVDRFDRASLLTRLTSDVSQVQNFINGLMRIFVKAPLLCIGSIIMAVRLNPQLSVIILIVVPIVALLLAWNMRMGFPLFLKVQKAMDRLNLVLREYLSGVRVVKAFNRFDYETDKLESANVELKDRNVAVMRAMAIFNPAIMLTVNLGILAVLWYGGYRVGSNLMPVGHIVAFINYMTQILFALMLISMVIMMLVRAKASVHRIGEVFALENRMKWEEETFNVGRRAAGRVEFENVTFSYEGGADDPVLRNITFQCEPGETIGIIGSTGSGKTSLISLIPRFYDVEKGTVKVHGVDVNRLEPTVLRQEIALVPQKAFLFSGTIRENLLWGNPHATQEELEEAARIAQAHEFIDRLPEGYETVLGQKGVNLSGGQKQRLSIARALVRKPAILLLDDCTSAVDVGTEERIKAELKKAAADVTCFLIAQRIQSVMDADRILVLEQGEIVGLGTHEELLASCSVYQEIYISQGGQEVPVDVRFKVDTP